MTCPTLIVLDINLPKKQGGDVLQHMRLSRRCAEALVIVASTSDSAKEREQMRNLGADDYFHKPSQYDEFMKRGDIVNALLSGPHPLAEGNRSDLTISDQTCPLPRSKPTCFGSVHYPVAAWRLRKAERLRLCDSSATEG